MSTIQQPEVVTPEQQRALEHNVFVSASAATEQVQLLRSIDTTLKHIFWLFALIGFCAAFVVGK